MSSTFRFKVGPKKVGIRGQQLKYVARPFYASRLTEDNIIEQIVRNYHGLNKGMVYMVIDAILREFRNFLFYGHPVKLKDFGTFRVSFNSTSHDTPDGFTQEDIKNPRIIFTPDARLREELKREIEFEEYK